jgi:hypothetical protein
MLGNSIVNNIGKYWKQLQILNIIMDFILKAIHATTTASRCSTTSYSNGCSTAVSTSPNRFIIK